MFVDVPDDVMTMLQLFKAKQCHLVLFSNIGETLYKDLVSRYPIIFSMFEESVISKAADNFKCKTSRAYFETCQMTIDALPTINVSNRVVFFIDDKHSNLVNGATWTSWTGILHTTAVNTMTSFREIGII